MLYKINRDKLQRSLGFYISGGIVYYRDDPLGMVAETDLRMNTITVDLNHRGVTLIGQGKYDMSELEKAKEESSWQRLTMENERMKLKMSDEYMRAKSDKSEYQKAEERRQRWTGVSNNPLYASKTTNNSGPFTSGSVAMLRPGETYSVRTTPARELWAHEPLIGFEFQKKQDRSKAMHKLKFRKRRR